MTMLEQLDTRGATSRIGMTCVKKRDHVFLSTPIGRAHCNRQGIGAPRLFSDDDPNGRWVDCSPVRAAKRKPKGVEVRLETSHRSDVDCNLDRGTRQIGRASVGEE